jgi:hypothetical protein
MLNSVNTFWLRYTLTVGEPPEFGETCNDIHIKIQSEIKCIKRSKVYRTVGVISDGMSINGIWMNLGGLGV